MDNEVYYLFEELSQVLGAVGSMLMALIVIVGLIQCFFGFKLMRVWFAIWGFGIGFLISGTCMGFILNYSNAGIALISAFLGGILGAVLLYRVYIIGVFLTNAVMAGLCLIMLLGASRAIIVFAVIGAIIVGVCSCKFVRIWTILTTGFSGGMLAGNAFVPMMQMYNPGLAMVIGFVISILGVLFQRKTTGGKLRAEKKAAKKAAKAETVNHTAEEMSQAVTIEASEKTEATTIAETTSPAEIPEPVSEVVAQQETEPAEKAIIVPQTISENKAVLTEKLPEKGSITEKIFAKLPEKDALVEKIAAKIPEKDAVVEKLSAKIPDKNMMAEKLSAKASAKENFTEKVSAKFPDKEALEEKLSAKIPNKETITESIFKNGSKKTLLIAGAVVLVLILLLTMCGKKESVEHIYETGSYCWGDWDDNGYSEIWYTENGDLVLIMDEKIVSSGNSRLEEVDWVNGEYWFQRISDDYKELEFINSKGETMIDIGKIVGKDNIGDNEYLDFYYGYCILYNDGYWGAIDMQGNIIVPFEHTEYYTVEDIIWWNYS